MFVDTTYVEYPFWHKIQPFLIAPMFAAGFGCMGKTKQPCLYRCKKQLPAQLKAAASQGHGELARHQALAGWGGQKAGSSPLQRVEDGEAQKRFCMASLGESRCAGPFSGFSPVETGGQPHLFQVPEGLPAAGLHHQDLPPQPDLERRAARLRP